MKPLIAISSDASVSAESSGTIEVVTGVSSNGNVSLSAVEVSILINDVDSAHNSYSGVICSQIKYGASSRHCRISESQNSSYSARVQATSV